MQRKVKIGFDFDGVIAYNPFRICRAPLAFFKRHILGIKKLNFFYPTNPYQRIFWQILHESSILPANGVDLLKKVAKEKKIEAHLITGRFSFLDDHLHNWLKRYQLIDLFKSVNINKNDEQPHLFKEKVIKKLKLDYFIEDNWDIVDYLQNKKIAKIIWIYNLVDRYISYEHKFPYLRKALEYVLQKENKTIND